MVDLVPQWAVSTIEKTSLSRVCDTVSTLQLNHHRLLVTVEVATVISIIATLALQCAVVKEEPSGTAIVTG